MSAKEGEVMSTIQDDSESLSHESDRSHEWKSGGNHDRASGWIVSKICEFKNLAHKHQGEFMSGNQDKFMGEN